MNTNLHKYLEPRNTRNNTGRFIGFFLCLPYFPWLEMNDKCLALNAEFKNNSYLITHNSALGEAGCPKKILR